MNFNRVVFSDGVKKDLIPAWKDYVNHYRKETFGKNIVINAGRTLAEKEALVNKLAMSAIEGMANLPQSEFFSDENKINHPNYKFAFFAVVNTLVDIVTPDIIASDFYMFADVKTIGRNESCKFTLKSNDLFEVSVIGNSRRHVNAQRQFIGETTLTPTNHAVTTQVDLYRVLIGEESLAEYAMKIILSIENEIALDIVYAMQNSFDTRTANFKATGFSKEGFKKLATRVAAANGGKKTIAVGTELALMDVLPEKDALTIGLGETYNAIGYLPIFMSTPLIALNQHIDWTSADYDFSISDDFIYFVSPGLQKLVRVIFAGEGLSIMDDEFARGNLVQNATIQKAWATGIVTNAKHAVMKVK